MYHCSFISYAVCSGSVGTYKSRSVTSMMQFHEALQSTRNFLNFAVVYVVLVCNFVSYSDWLRAGQSADQIPVEN